MNSFYLVKDLDMLFIIVVGALGAFEIVNLLLAGGNKLFKTVLGYAWIPEIILSIGLPALAALTGTISGVVIAAVSGFMITMTLMVCKKVVGTRKYVKNETTGKREWVETNGMPFSQFVRELGFKSFYKAKSFVSDVARPVTA